MHNQDPKEISLQLRRCSKSKYCESKVSKRDYAESKLQQPTLEDRSGSSDADSEDGDYGEEGEQDMEEGQEEQSQGSARSWNSICFECNTKDRRTKKGVELVLCEGLGKFVDSVAIKDFEELNARMKCRNVVHMSCAEQPIDIEEHWHCKECLNIYNTIKHIEL